MNSLSSYSLFPGGKYVLVAQKYIFIVDIIYIYIYSINNFVIKNTEIGYENVGS